MQAAWELFQKRGYARTTVEQIAARAGLTERTFFRYFTDKREVLFWGAAALQNAIVDAIANAADTASPLDAVAAALETAETVLPRVREYARTRQALIAAHAELRERELIKLTTLASAIAAALRGRGIAAPVASLTAEAGIAVFKVAFERWIGDPKPRELSHHIRAALDDLKSITRGTSAAFSTSQDSKRPRRNAQRSRLRRPARA